MNDMCRRRLHRELNSLMRNPVESITTRPDEKNILEVHYVLEGSVGTPYEGGHYHGLLRFPPEYPLKPPSVLMYTPSGRFMTGRRLCLSMSDYHPESWNPMWSISTILTGLFSFMNDTSPTLGSLETSDSTKREFARDSLEFNCRNATFKTLFPDLVELQDERRRKAAIISSNQQQNVSGVTNADAVATVAPAWGVVATIGNWLLGVGRGEGEDVMVQGALAPAAAVAVALMSVGFALRFVLNY